MSEAKAYQREPNGKRFAIRGGLNTVLSPDLVPDGQYPYLQNARSYLGGRIVGRATTGNALYTLAAPPHTIVRMNDSSPSGPAAGYVRVIGAAGAMYVNSTEAASGFSGNPLSIITSQPDQSVQPWAYIGDTSQAVTITSSGQTCTGMVKVRSDGLTRKTGIKEPQSAPLVGVNTVNVTQWLTLPANTPPWTNIGGVNANYNYSGTDTQPPYPATIATPVAGSTVTLTVTGTATVNGSSHAPGDSGPTSANYPGDFISGAKIVVFAFTGANGNIIAQATAGGSPPVVGNVGASATLTVPANAAQLQIGINSEGGTFSANSGSYLVEAVVSTSAITLVSSIVGLITAYVWGDSPHSGPVASYIWKNPNDQGTGIARTTGTAQASATNNSLIFDSTPEDGTVPVIWSTLNSAGSTIGSIDLFSPALESDGYQDFNACITGSIWFPQGGTYAIQIQNKDQIMFGMGAGATSTGGQVYGIAGQSITVVDGLPLLYVSTPNGSGGAVTQTIQVTVPAAGIYPYEFDWDYYYHTGRSLIVEVAPTPGAAVALLPPLPQGVRTNVQYWAKYRAAETGAQSNPSPPSPNQQTPVLANTVQSPYSTDPQVTKVDYYRQDDGLANPTYVATGPNDGLGGTINGIVYNTAIEDTLDDLAAANNQLMQTDDFEPFPSIDTPKSGKVTIVDGVVNWKSGDQFNIRWLPGTLMQIGSPTQNAYSLVSRPISATQIVIPDVPDTIGDAAGDGVPYNIAQPILAQQPLPSMWGPDAYGFVWGCGDAYQPNAAKWTKAYNPDSAPQTNVWLLSSLSDQLMGGELVNGVSMIFSTRFAWLMYPNFADAQATTEGIAGNQWNPILATNTRGLYIRNCLCSIGGGKAVAYRVSDGISITSGGADKSITGNIYNLFPHENFTPQPITLGGFTVYPPNDSLPQKLKYQNGYLYWDYQDANSIYRTLVYDEVAEGWSVDVGQTAFSAHSGDYAPNVNDTAVGCADGSVRVLQSAGTEVAISAVLTPVDNGGDARAFKRLGDVFIKALIAASNPVTVALYANQYNIALTGFAPTSLTGAGTLAPYIVDFTDGDGQDLIDVGLSLSWPTASTDQLELWQPDFLPLPENTQDRPTDWQDLGSRGNNFVQGMILEADTLNQAKAIAVEDEYGSLHIPDQVPFTLNGQQKIALTFNPPFVSHIGRIVSSDGVPWRVWGVEWQARPYPESAVRWVAELTAFGGKGWQHLGPVLNVEYSSVTSITLAFTVDSENGSIAPAAITIPSSGGTQTKIKLEVTANKWKLLTAQASSTAPFVLFVEGMEALVAQWGENYRAVPLLGGMSATGANV